MQQRDGAPPARGRWCCFSPDLLFFANLANFLLMAAYVWADYGRGYLAEDQDLLNSLYMALAFAYVAVGGLYLYAHEGELPWPSGFSMWSDWLSCLGNVVFAATACLYPQESSEAVNTLVLVAEASASLVNGAAAICGLAGWWMESNKETAARGCGSEAWGLLTSLDFWAHATNFLPAVVYMGSSVAAAEINYARLDDLSTGAGAVRLPELLRQLSRVYWYGDLLWTLNGAFWLALWVRDYQYEEELVAEEEQEAAAAAAAGEKGGGSSSSSAGSGSGLGARLLAGAGQGRAEEEEGEAAASLAALHAGSSTAQRVHRKRHRIKRLLRDTEPYHLYIPFLRWAYAVGGCKGSYFSLRGSHEVKAAEEGGSGGSVAAYRAPAAAAGSLNGGSEDAFSFSSSGGGGGGGSGSGGSARGAGALVSGKRVLGLLAVSSLAANAEGGARRAAAPVGSGVEMLDLSDRRR